MIQYFGDLRIKLSFRAFLGDIKKKITRVLSIVEDRNLERICSLNSDDLIIMGGSWILEAQLLRAFDPLH